MKVFAAVLATLIASVVSEITSPAPGTTWKVGQTAQVSVAPGKSGETVNIFFNSDRTASVGGGSIDKKGATFTFTVPASLGGTTAELIAVHRISDYLLYVDTLNVNIVK